MSNSCPVCNKDDSIQKLSAILREGTSSVVHNSRSVEYSIADMAQVLARPDEPKLPFGYRWGKYSCLILSTPFILLSCWVNFYVMLIFLINSTNAFMNLLIYFVVFGCTLTIVAFVLTILIFRVQSRVDKKDANDIVAEHLRWHRAMGIWERLYFCYRDNVVFDPLTQKTCQPYDLKPFIFDINTLE